MNPPPPKSNVGLWIMLAALVLLIPSGIAAFLVGGFFGRSHAPPPRPTHAEPVTPPPRPTLPPPIRQDGSDPLDGHWTLADATKDLPGSGPLVTKITTSLGVIECRLYDDKAPISVANFIGLATGSRVWKEPGGSWVNRPAYDGTTFHRVIKGFVIQGGDPTGTGKGEPGFTFQDETWPGAKHDRAGLLCMANRGKDTNGAQFFITDAPTPTLDTLPTTYTIFGECAPLQVVHEIANVKTGRQDRPEVPVVIRSVTVARSR